MPIYEYQCAKCGKTIEVIQKMSDKPLKKHEGCGGALTKLISASGFQFKGTGWYVTDYARKGESAGSGDESKSKTDDGAKAKDGEKTKDGAAGESSTSAKADKSTTSSSESKSSGSSDSSTSTAKQS